MSDMTGLREWRKGWQCDGVEKVRSMTLRRLHHRK